MTMLPQPAPDAPTPPISAAAMRSIKWRNWIWGVGICSVIVTTPLLLLSMFVRTRGGPGHDFVRSINNMKTVGLALFSFSENYGGFPGDTTISKVQADYPGSTIPMGTTTANDYFRQLLSSEVADNESIFYGWPGPKPDNVFIGARALEKGECSFAYIKGVGATSLPETPLVVFPLLKGKLLFDYKLCEKWGGRVAILRVDNSVTTHPVDKTGHVYIGGKDLFDPTQPFWGGKLPDVKWPE